MVSSSECEKTLSIRAKLSIYQFVVDWELLLSFVTSIMFKSRGCGSCSTVLEIKTAGSGNRAS